MNDFDDFGPVWMASSPFTSNIKLIMKAIDNGADCIVTKSVTSSRRETYAENLNMKATLIMKGKMKAFGGNVIPIPIIDEATGEVTVHSRSLFCTSTNSDMELLSIKEANLLYDQTKEYSPETKVVQSFAPRKLDDFNDIKMLKADAIEISPRFYYLSLERPYTVMVWGLYGDEYNIDDVPDEMRDEYEREYQKAEKFNSEMRRVMNELEEGISNLDVDVPVLYKCERSLAFRYSRQMRLNVDGFTYGNTEKFGSYLSKCGFSLQKSGKGSVCGEFLKADTKGFIPLIRRDIIGPDKYLSASGGILDPDFAGYLLENGANSVQLCSVVYFDGFEGVKRISDFVKA